MFTTMLFGTESPECCRAKASLPAIRVQFGGTLRHGQRADDATAEQDRPTEVHNLAWGSVQPPRRP